MSKGKVGLYLGVNSAAAVVVDNKTIVSCARFDLASLEEETDIVNEEIRWEALINRTLREAGAEEKDVYVSITDRDFIFRSFEMPLMKKKEVASSVVYEIEKYIPFKVRELRWDYGYSKFPKDKKINISFLGVRNESLKKFQEILVRLNLHSAVIEPSSLSIARIIKSLPNLSGLKNFAVLDFSDSEAYLTFFYYDLPIFNRYLVIPQKDGKVNLEKLIEAVRLSYLYFKREFKSYEPEKIVVVGNQRDEKFLKSLSDDLQAEIEMFSPQDFSDKENTAVDSLKALGVVSREYYPFAFNPVLMTTKEHTEGGFLKKVPLKLSLIGLFVSLGLIVSVSLSIFMGNKLSTEKKKLEQEESKVILPREKISSWESLKKDIKDKKGKAASLQKLSRFKRISPFLDKLPHLFPRGLWLDNLDLVPVGSRYKVIMRGNIFLGDSYQERLEIDKFVLNLKNDKTVKSIFSKIEMTSSEQRRKGEFTVTFFAMRLE
jgi:Tfp pilus assembly PilM family ATPase